MNLDTFRPPQVRRVLLVAQLVFSLSHRQIRQRPRLYASTFTILLSCLLYWYLGHIIRDDDFGRWYWNYLVALHPLFAFVIPNGTWGPLTGPPRWVESIYQAPWMGDWEIPKLTRPVYDYHRHHRIVEDYKKSSSISGSHSSRHDSSSILTTTTPNTTSTTSIHSSFRHLISPVILKLHIFSTPTEKALAKRNLIRSVSPLLNLPKEYRHLVELKFVLGYPHDSEHQIDPLAEKTLEEEKEIHGDLLRLEGMKWGENLRDGKIFDWIHAAARGIHGGRDGWYLFKMDDDNLILDRHQPPSRAGSTAILNPHRPYYLGTSLNRWPAYHFHFTGMLTGFSRGVVKTISSAVSNMTRYEIEAEWDDDVLTGEIMYCLPPAPHCRSSLPSLSFSNVSLLNHCDPHTPPPWGYIPPPPNPDPRTGLIRYDFLRRAGDYGLWWIKGDLATHGWWLKYEQPYLEEWRKRVEGRIWKPPKWIESLAET